MIEYLLPIIPLLIIYLSAIFIFKLHNRVLSYFLFFLACIFSTFIYFLMIKYFDPNILNSSRVRNIYIFDAVIMILLDIVYRIIKKIKGR